MFAPEGYNVISLAVLIGVLLAIAGVLVGFPWGYVPVAIGIGLVAFNLWFFRDPHRVPPADAREGNLILSPADGKVITIEETDEPLYLKGPARKISIFLSPIDVHVNRIPADGVIEYEEYVPGEYLVAWHPKASELNERAMLGLRHASGAKILFKQIAGLVARRVIYHVRTGDEVKAGQRYGIVKFGSRMDVLLPPDTEITIKENDRVFGGTSIIGRLKGGDTAEVLRQRERAGAHE